MRNSRFRDDGPPASGKTKSGYRSCIPWQNLVRLDAIDDQGRAGQFRVLVSRVGVGTSKDLSLVSVPRALVKGAVPLVPDEIMPQVMAEHIEPALSAGDTLVFASGYNIYFKRRRRTGSACAR